MAIGRSEVSGAMKGVTQTGDLVNLRATASGDLGVDLIVKDIQIGAVEIKDQTTDVRAHVDADGLHVNLQKSVPLKAMSGGTEIPSHTSPNDFAALYDSPNSISLFNIPVDLTFSTQLMKIVQLKADGTYAEFVNGLNCSMTYDFATSTITVNGVGTPFLNTDEYRVSIKVQEKGYDSSCQRLKTGTVSTVETLLATGQAIDVNWTPIAAVIDTREYNELYLYLDLDINNGQDVRLRAVGLTDPLGPERYLLPIEEVTATDIKVIRQHIEFDEDEDQQIILKIDTGAIPWIAIETQAGVPGIPNAAAWVTVYYNQMWR